MASVLLTNGREDNTGTKHALGNIKTEREDGLSKGGKNVTVRGVEERDQEIEVKKYPRKQSRRETAIQVERSMPINKHEALSWDGWGYKDSGFVMSGGVARFRGTRYEIRSETLPHLADFLNKKLGTNHQGDVTQDPNPLPEEREYDKSLMTTSLIKEVEALEIKISTDVVDRVTRSQGQALEDIYKLIHKKRTRIPDAVVWPTCHEEVEELVKLAERKHLVIIPYGGGTSVAGGLQCPEDETRPIMSLDMMLMNEILWLDEENLVVCAEAGVVGQDLERELNKAGYTTGHEPDSIEFSTLGGWVATRASGMKRNLYGNIEELVVHVRMVTPSGVLEKHGIGRVSSGPDFDHIIMGSEGSYGVITEVCVKIRPFPSFCHYGSLVFPDFKAGVSFLKKVAKKRLQPPSIRLLDNNQFQLGLALRPPATFMSSILDGLKFAYLEKIKGFSQDEMCLCTMTFEGEKDEVLAHEAKLNNLGMEFGGVPGGYTNGKRGYMMTYVVGYMRDFALKMNYASESMETSAKWSLVHDIMAAIRDCIHKSCAEIGTPNPLILSRIAQSYDTNCCIYTYYVFNTNPEQLIEHVEFLQQALKETVMPMGGSISHHHGIGKHRMKYYETSVSTVGRELFLATKKRLDPHNIFAVGNIATASKL